MYNEKQDELIKKLSEIKGEEKMIDAIKQGATYGPFKRTSKFTIEDENKYLVLQLSRFKIDNLIKEKIMNKVHVPFELEFAENKFTLFGSIVHIGDKADSGHYVFVRTLDESKGIVYDDSAVIETNDYSKTFSEKFRSEYDRNMYVLIFKRNELPAQQPTQLTQTPAEPAPAKTPEELRKERAALIAAATNKRLGTQSAGKQTRRAKGKRTRSLKRRTIT
jgi:hypothetical protein